MEKILIGFNRGVYVSDTTSPTLVLVPELDGAVVPVFDQGPGLSPAILFWGHLFVLTVGGYVLARLQTSGVDLRY